MKRLLILLLVLPVSAVAQDDAPEGRDLMSEALRLFMRGLMQEMEPAMDDLGQLLDNLDAYHPPEVLPNGDIIIRRREPLTPESDEPDGEIEL